jgi:sugar-specific transcriptional regulator TrmB
MKKELIELGMSEKEAEIFMICVKAGEVTANRVSDLAGLARSTTYDLLDKLRHKGFITTFVKDKKTYFLANNSEILITNLEEEKRDLLKDIGNRKEILKDISPKLKEMQNQINKKPIAEIFEGKVSISGILDDIVEDAKSNIKIIGSQENAIEKIDYKTDKFRNRRKERGIKTYQILEDSKEARKEKLDKLTELRFLKSLKESKDAIFIYNDVTVHLILSGELTAIRIKSKEYTKAQEINFDELWSKARK